ncbi:MAG TPA: LytTR family DNA-binding domain-containing protein [Ferruginibacter sp.]|nr:LytTR family DNA-binding domain-containing protein [Ferruginibacter sp.]
MRENMHTETIWITEGSKRIPVLTNEILYISASSPYVQLHINERKYLYKESLKSLMPQLDPNTFVRVHKSYIVNIRSVQSFQSRLNGDYDINLINGTQIRLSRSYSKAFKDIWTGGHRLTI